MTAPKLTARQIRDFLPKMPFNSLLGIRLTTTHSDGVTIECAVRPDLLNGFGRLHGGVAATLSDAAVGISLNRHFGGKRQVTTVELKVNYFKAVSEGRLYARAYLQRIGSTICVGRVDLSDSKKNLVGTATVTYMVLNARM